MKPAATPEALEQALARETIELADGVTPEEVMRLALDGIDIAYRAHGDGARVSLLAVQADWIMQHLARTEAWAKDEQAKRHAAEDKLVEARSRAATAEADVQRVTAERDEYAEALMQVAEVGGWQASAGLAHEVRTRIHTATAEAASLLAEVEALKMALTTVKTWIDTDLPAGTSRAGTLHRVVTKALDRTALARAATAGEGRSDG